MSLEINGTTYNSTSYIKAFKEELILDATWAEKGGAMPPGCENAYAYIRLVLAGVDRGIEPSIAPSVLSIIGGKVSMSAQALLGLAYRDAGIKFEMVRSDDQGAEMIFYREGRDPYPSSFTIEDAKKAGLYPPAKAGSAWAKWTKDMLVARCITRGLRYLAADVVTGIYSVEEMNDGLETVEMTPEFKSATEKQEANLNDLATAAMVKEPPVIPARKSLSASQVQAALPGKVKEAKLDLSALPEIELVLKGDKPDVAATAKHVLAGMNEVYGEQARKVLGDKVKSYGVASSNQLSMIDFLDLYRWAALEVRSFRARVAQADQAAQEVQPQPAVKDFEPNRGAKQAVPDEITDDMVHDLYMAVLANDAAFDDMGSLAENYAWEKGAGNSQQRNRLVYAELQKIAAKHAGSAA